MKRNIKNVNKIGIALLTGTLTCAALVGCGKQENIAMQQSDTWITEADTNNTSISAPEDNTTNLNETQTGDFTCPLSIAHIDAKEMSESMASDYRMSTGMTDYSGLELYADSKIQSITIHGTEYDYAKFIDALNGDNTALESIGSTMGMLAQWLSDDPKAYSPEILTDLVAGQTFFMKTQLSDNDKNTLGLRDVDMEWNLQDDHKTVLIEEQTVYGTNLYDEASMDQFYITCDDGTIIHPVHIDKDNKGIVYLPITVHAVDFASANS